MDISSAKEDEITFFVYADEFFYAASHLESSTNPGKVAIASYYLYGHSLELLFKSYLFKYGVSLEILKKEVGHDLERALHKGRVSGLEDYLSIDDHYVNIVRGINKYYSTKEFEYMSRTEKTFPHLYEVKDVVNKTLNAVHEHLLNALWKNA